MSSSKIWTGIVVVCVVAVGALAWKRITFAHDVKRDTKQAHELEQLRADVVVDCAGPSAAEVMALAGRTVPFRHEPGRLIYTTPVATSLQRVIHAPGGHFRPDGGGRGGRREGGDYSGSAPADRRLNTFRRRGVDMAVTVFQPESVQM